MRLNHLLTNAQVYFSTSISEHSKYILNTKINIKEIIQLNRKVALNKVKYTLSTSREPRGENPLAIISDAVYTRCCAIRHDKSLTVNCLVPFMTYWHKVKMSCVDRFNLLCCDAESGHQASGRVNSPSARALWGIGITAYVSTFLVSIFHLPLSRS